MPQLGADDIRAWPRERCQSEYDSRLDRVAAIREGAGGSIEKVTEPGLADEVRNLMADTNLLGERIDELGSMATLEARFNGRSQRQLPEGIQPFDVAKVSGQVTKQPGPSDLGARFLDSDAWQMYKAEGAKGMEATLPITSLWAGYRGIGEVPSLRAALFDTTDFPSQADFRPDPIETLYQANNIGPLMAQGTTDALTVRYPVETVTATGAAAVAEGAAKPEADITFAATDESVRKIAVLLPLTDEALADEAFLRAYLNARLRLFVQNEEDRQLLIGTGTAPEIRGILNRSGINTATSYSISGGTPTPAQALIDSVFKASMRVRESFLIPDTAVMRSATWEIARLAKDANNMYLLGPPAGDAPLRLWGLQVVLNERMPAQAATNKPVLVGAFRAAAMVIRRSGIALAVSDSHASFFAENKIMLRAEERLALAVFRPAGFAAVTSAT